jgi:hypothetical protein
VGVQFTTEIVGLKVDHGLVNETDDLAVSRSNHILNTLKSAGGEKTSAVTGL